MINLSAVIISMQCRNILSCRYLINLIFLAGKNQQNKSEKKVLGN